jgi:hypothetical protein
MPSPSIVHIVIDDSTSKVITGTYEWDRTNNGKLIIPAYNGEPSSPSAGEFYWDISTNVLYRRNDTNTDWDAQESLAALHASTHEVGGDDLVTHDNLTGAGTNSHENIDTHIGDDNIHFTESSIDHGSITGLSDDDHTQYLNSTRVETWLGTKTTTNLTEGTNLYYTESRVSSNSDVSANTSARHSHSNKTLLDSLTSIGTGTSYLADDGSYKEITITTDFISLTDTPSAYTSAAGKFIRVNATPDGLEFITLATVATSGSHADLSSVQGGITDQYYHLNLAQHTIATQVATSSLSGYLSSTDWNTFNSKFDDLMTTRGDILIRNASNVTSRLAIGSDGQVLTTDGTDIYWDDNSGTGGLTENTHQSLDTLLHDLDEDYYLEYTRNGIDITNATYWTDSDKILKVREHQYSYTGSKITQEIVIQYDAIGSVEETLTFTYTYDNMTLINVSSIRS